MIKFLECLRTYKDNLRLNTWLYGFKTKYIVAHKAGATFMKLTCQCYLYINRPIQIQ